VNPPDECSCRTRYMTIAAYYGRTLVPPPTLDASTGLFEPKAACRPLLRL
jgi:hypothetical protein